MRAFSVSLPRLVHLTALATSAIALSGWGHALAQPASTASAPAAPATPPAAPAPSAAPPAAPAPSAAPAPAPSAAPAPPSASATAPTAVSPAEAPPLPVPSEADSELRTVEEAAEEAAEGAAMEPGPEQDAMSEPMPAVEPATPAEAATPDELPTTPSALATALDAPSPRIPPPVAKPARRSGFYARLSAGWGSYSEFMRTTRSSDYGGHVLVQTIGIAGAGELALGGGISRRVVLGGGIWSSNLLASTVRIDESSPNEPPAELDPPLRATALLGPFVNWYLGEAPDLYVQAAVGLASVARTPIRAGNDGDRYAAYGAGVLFGVGAEWPLSGDFSIGVTGRISAIAARGRDGSDVSWTHAVTSAPAVLVTLTYY